MSLLLTAAHKPSNRLWARLAHQQEHITKHQSSFVLVPLYEYKLQYNSVSKYQRTQDCTKDSRLRPNQTHRTCIRQSIPNSPKSLELSSWLANTMSSTTEGESRLLASERLRGADNYHSWKSRVYNILEGKGLEDFIEPTCIKPEPIEAQSTSPQDLASSAARLAEIKA